MGSKLVHQTKEKSFIGKVILAEGKMNEKYSAKKGR